MAIKVVWADWPGQWLWIRPSIDTLKDEGMGVTEINWTDLEDSDWDREEVIRKCRGATVAILHFNSIPLADARKIVERIQDGGSKTVVLSAVNLCGADGVISKPFSPMELVRLVRRITNS